ncbi:alpha/beta hydrolase [Cohnella endophytica]|uniref:Alpha/beta hydrolase n=1 Tax=Cohnella endophytica TaxID=2419778 RepID=A0A494X9I0_9BACL|nr:alpha/beta hydrolase [Cohnella endophytica]RKP47375.1 alpha/beta hydrolase [Cohnella endophytica]
MNLEYRITAKRKIKDRLKRRLSGMYARDVGIWRFSIVALWLLSCVGVALSAMGMPTGFGVLFDVFAGLALNTIAFAVCSAAITIIISLVGLRIPRFTTGSTIYSGILACCILYDSQFGLWGAILYGTAVTVIAAGLGIAAGWIARMRRTRRVALAAIVVIVAYSTAGYPRFLLAGSGADADSAADDGKAVVQALGAQIPDPSMPGDFEFRTFTYGSGEDLHRSEFGPDAAELSSSVDASSMISDWPWLRDKFWGFDEKSLPLNGRVWMPDGEGPFPVVLMVHGNHLMEQFSDDGYGYLGELLASKGIIAISVDENFLNYSVWSGIPDQDMKLRAWLLLKHIGQLQLFNADRQSPFYGRIDFGNVALLGHSRGGQAAAMATDRERWFPNDRGLPDQASYTVRSVIGLAPTDTAIDGQWSELQDVSYLTLQGAKDADLVNFYGDRQYGRVSFVRNTQAFKASLYIEDANHSQFNTEWGESDNALPASLFIRPKELLEPEDQRQVAKTYVAAFLEATLQDDESYDSLFRDYRAGLSFLPATRYFNQFESGGFRRIADFSGQDRIRLSEGVTAEATALTDWRHTDARDRQGEGKGDTGLELEWKEKGSYTVHLRPEAIGELEDIPILMFSLANMERDLADEEPFGDELTPDEAAKLEERMEAGLSIDVEVADEAGNAARLPLSRFMETEPQVATKFTWLPGMESVLSEGKFKDIEEPVYQTYELPLERFAAENPAFDPSEWAEVTFYFNEGPGKIMLDDLGWMPE